MVNRTSVQKAKFGGMTNECKGTKAHKYVIKYTRLDGDKAGAESTAAKLVSQFTEAELTLLGQLREGTQTEFVVTKEETPWINNEGKEMTSWVLKTLSDISTWVDKPAKKPWNGGSNKNNNSYDNLGQQIGNSMTNAVNSLGQGHTVEQYRQRALELALASNWVREQLESATTVAKTTTVSNNIVNSLAADDEIEIDGFDDIDL